MPSLVEVLSLLAVGVGLGPVVSFLMERWGWFQKVSGEVRFWLVFGLCVGLPVAARLLLGLVPGEVWAVLEPYWQSMALGFLAFLASQGYHLVKRLRAET